MGKKQAIKFGIAQGEIYNRAQKYKIITLLQTFIYLSVATRSWWKVISWENIEHPTSNSRVHFLQYVSNCCVEFADKLIKQHQKPHYFLWLPRTRRQLVPILASSMWQNKLCIVKLMNTIHIYTHTLSDHSVMSLHIGEIVKLRNKLISW